MDNIKALLKKLWNGEETLLKTFWLYYFIGILLLRIIVGALGSVFAIVIVAWAGFMVLPIWRSADKYGGNKLFALAAKVAAVVIALGVLGTLI